jgi:hypothetical protein
MKPADQKLLKDIRKLATDLADMLKTANDAGYAVNVGMDNVSGTLQKFEVKQMIPIDVDSGIN